jgi:ankyrin repeat protein
LPLIARVLGYNKAAFDAWKLHNTYTAAQILQKGTDIDAKWDGAKIEKETPSYKTPLHLATLHPNVDFISLLLDRGGALVAFF